MSTSACSVAPYKYLKPIHPESSPSEQQFVDLVNGARATLGLKALSINQNLNVAADSHSYWQDAAFGYNGLNHSPGCNGSDPWARIADAGYRASWEGEVTLVRFPAADAVTAFNMFKGSPGHWALLTSPNFTEIGVGQAEYHWTGDLGAP